MIRGWVGELLNDGGSQQAPEGDQEMDTWVDKCELQTSELMEDQRLESVSRISPLRWEMGGEARHLQGLCGDAEPCSLLEFCKGGGASRLWMELDKVEALRSFWSSF